MANKIFGSFCWLHNLFIFITKTIFVLNHLSLAMAVELVFFVRWNFYLKLTFFTSYVSTSPSKNNINSDWSAAETKKEERHPNELQIGKLEEDPNFCFYDYLILKNRILLGLCSYFIYSTI